MAIPRSSGQTSAPFGAVANFTFANQVFTAVTANATVETVVNVPRSFKPQKAVQVVFTGPFQSGLTVGDPYVAGNSPSCAGCSPNTYQLHIPITNSTAGSLTPTTQTFRVVQD